MSKATQSFVYYVNLVQVYREKIVTESETKRSFVDIVKKYYAGMVGTGRPCCNCY